MVPCNVCWFRTCIIEQFGQKKCTDEKCCIFLYVWHAMNWSNFSACINCNAVSWSFEFQYHLNKGSVFWFIHRHCFHYLKFLWKCFQCNLLRPVFFHYKFFHTPGKLNNICIICLHIIVALAMYPSTLLECELTLDQKCESGDKMSCIQVLEYMVVVNFLTCPIVLLKYHFQSSRSLWNCTECFLQLAHLRTSACRLC